MEVKVHACIGGSHAREDVKKLESGSVQIVIGTPGRVNDIMRNGFFKTDHLRIFIIDETEEMLNRGFKHNIMDILKLVPEKT